MKVIEFMGMPRTGKSTQFQITETVLRYQENKRVRCLYEADKSCPLDKTDRFQFHSWTLHHTINKLMEARAQDLDFLLVERGVWDQAAFSIALYLNGEISKKQCNTQKEYCRQFGFLEDAVLKFVIDPETSLKREQKYHHLQGMVTNKKFLSCLQEAYKQITQDIQQELHVVNSEKPLSENLGEVLKYILKEK